MVMGVVFLELRMEGGLLLFSIGFSCLLKMGLCVCVQLYLVNADMYLGSGSILKL